MFDHERRDVYRLSLDFVAWAYVLVKTLRRPDRFGRDQLLRASQSIPLNIAEGNGKRPGPDRKRFLQIASGSARESAAILDVLVACQAIPAKRCQQGKEFLDRIVAMLVRMKRRQQEECGDFQDQGEEKTSASRSASATTIYKMGTSRILQEAQ